MTLTTLKDFAFNDQKINIYGTIDKPLFMANEIGDLLGLTNIRKNLQSIPNEWKTLINVSENNSVTKSYNIISAGNPNKTFITEQAVYKLVFRSNKPFADEFTNKVCEILKELRTTGKYQISRPSTITKQLTFSINNERDLHHRIVNFIREYYPDALFNANLGQLQDTSYKRIESACSGYLAGSPDLEIKECSDKFIGLCIEFKNPNGSGSIKDNQASVHQKLRERKYKVLVSNDYDYLLVQIKEYLDNRRYLCEYCHKKPYLCKSLKSREVHYRVIHRII